MTSVGVKYSRSSIQMNFSLSITARMEL